MKSVKEIINKYESANFSVEVEKINVCSSNAAVLVKSVEGKLNIYEQFIKELKKEGYTVFE